MGVGVSRKKCRKMYQVLFYFFFFFFPPKAWAKLSQRITGSFISLRFFLCVFLREGRGGGAFSYYYFKYFFLFELSHFQTYCLHCSC